MEKSLIFDLDGTLWDATECVKDGWNEALSEDNINMKLSYEDVTSFQGLTLAEISEKLLPDFSAEQRKKSIYKCENDAIKILRLRGGILYPDLLKTLTVLKKEYKLFLVSNCTKGYLDSFLDFHGTRKFFDDTECNGVTGLCKGENIKLILKRNNLKSGIYIGDTEWDKTAADYAGIPFVYALYGFGKDAGYKYKIEKFSDLPEILKKIKF